MKNPPFKAPEGGVSTNLLMTLSMVIWGGSWVSAKAISGMLPASTLTFWRFVFNVISLLPALFFLKGGLRVDRKGAFYTLLGAVFMALYFFFKGLSYGRAGAAGVLVTTTVPLATLALSIVFLGKKAAKKDITGLLLGLAGGAIQLGAWTLDAGRMLTEGNSYFLLCSLLWGALTICSQKAGETISPLLFSLLAPAFSSVLFFFPALPNKIGGVLEMGGIFWINIFYLSAISSAFATTAYFYASSRLGSYRASSFVFLVPLSAVILSWIFLGETPKITTIAGGLIAVTATYLINSKS